MLSPRRFRGARPRAAVAVVAAAAWLWSIGFASAEDRPIVIGTGPAAGNYFPAGGAICEIFNKARDGQGPRCLVDTSAGSQDNLDKLLAGQIDFALVQSDWQYLALNGGYGPESARIPQLRAVFSLHAHAIAIVAHPDAGIAALGDLKGRRVNLGPPGSAMRAAAETLLGTLDWSREDLGELTELGMSELSAALCTGRIDAFIVPVSHPDATVASAASRCGARLVGVPEELTNRLSGDWPFYAPVSVPAGIYGGQNEATNSYGFRVTLVTLAEVSEDAVYLLTQAVFADLRSFTARLPVLAGLTQAEMTRAGLVAELHPGAARYFKERLN